MELWCYKCAGEDGRFLWGWDGLCVGGGERDCEFKLFVWTVAFELSVSSVDVIVVEFYLCAVKFVFIMTLVVGGYLRDEYNISNCI